MSEVTDGGPSPEEIHAQLVFAQRENAFLKAGVDVGTPIGQLIFKGYDGPLEAEAIKSYVEAVAPTTATEPNKPPEDTVLLEGEAASTAQREALASNATGAGRPDPADPVREGRELATEAMKRGASEEEAIGGYVNHLVDAHMRGQKGLTVAERSQERGGRVLR